MLVDARAERGIREQGNQVGFGKQHHEALSPSGDVTYLIRTNPRCQRLRLEMSKKSGAFYWVTLPLLFDKQIIKMQFKQNILDTYLRQLSA
jgi:hypothetical protein